jgi:hypothetical protein
MIRQGWRLLLAGLNGLALAMCSGADEAPVEHRPPHAGAGGTRDGGPDTGESGAIDSSVGGTQQAEPPPEAVLPAPSSSGVAGDASLSVVNATGMSADAGIVVGTIHSSDHFQHAYVASRRGTSFEAELLGNRFERHGIDLGGALLSSATAVSSDGKTIVGRTWTGEVWLATAAVTAE